MRRAGNLPVAGHRVMNARVNAPAAQIFPKLVTMLGLNNEEMEDMFRPRALRPFQREIGKE
jgi:hypothetical protein